MNKNSVIEFKKPAFLMSRLIAFVGALAALFKKSFRYTPGAAEFEIHQEFLFWSNTKMYPMSRFSVAKLQHVAKESKARPEKGSYRLQLKGEETVNISFFSKLTEARQATLLVAQSLNLPSSL